MKASEIPIPKCRYLAFVLYRAPWLIKPRVNTGSCTSLLVASCTGVSEILQNRPRLPRKCCNKSGALFEETSAWIRDNVNIHSNRALAGHSAPRLTWTLWPSGNNAYVATNYSIQIPREERILYSSRCTSWICLDISCVATELKS